MNNFGQNFEKKILSSITASFCCNNCDGRIWAPLKMLFLKLSIIATLRCCSRNVLTNIANSIYPDQFQTDRIGSVGSGSTLIELILSTKW